MIFYMKYIVCTIHGLVKVNHVHRSCMSCRTKGYSVLGQWSDAFEYKYISFFLTIVNTVHSISLTYQVVRESNIKTAQVHIDGIALWLKKKFKIQDDDAVRPLESPCGLLSLPALLCLSWQPPGRGVQVCDLWLSSQAHVPRLGVQAPLPLHCLRLRYGLFHVDYATLSPNLTALDHGDFEKGSGQQSVTAFPEPHDANSFWKIESPFPPAHSACQRGAPIECDSTLRLFHLQTQRYLHSHSGHASPLSQNQEVSGYGPKTDQGDNWKVICLHDKKKSSKYAKSYWTREDPVRLRKWSPPFAIGSSEKRSKHKLSFQREFLHWSTKKRLIFVDWK